MSQSTHMIGVEEALAFILKHFEPLEPETIYILDALDRVLAEDILSDVAIPPFDNSSMDGYAVRAEDIAWAGPETPVTLRVVADIPAGTVADVPLGPGEAARIMTGAPLPHGADAVVPVEETDKWPATGRQARGTGAKVKILKAVAEEANVRRSGQDMQPGELVLPQGEPGCVLPTGEMRASHMELLNDWRDLVVRDGERVMTTWDGRQARRSLTASCLGCHTEKEKFCDRCHGYVGVTPYCWDCHLTPKGGAS